MNLTFRQKLVKPVDHQARLLRCRNVLTGKNEQGLLDGVSMFEQEVISFAHGEGIRRPHPSVIAAGIRALLDTEESALDNYLFLQRLEELDEKISEIFQSEGIPSSIARNICIDSGTTRIFLSFFHTVAQPGDIFLVAPTFYHTLVSWCDINKLVLQVVPTNRSDDFKLTPKTLEDFYQSNNYVRIGKQPKGLILFNPTQTGAIYTKEELESLADFCSRNDLVVLEDAIFMGTEYDQNASRHHLAGCPGMEDRCVTVCGASKVHSLANIRIGWACGPKQIIDKMNSFTTATSTTIPHVAKAMALAALKSPVDFLEANARECRERAALIKQLVAKANEQIAQALPPNCNVPIIEILHEPKAGHSILLSFDKMRGYITSRGSVLRDSVDVVRFFLNEAKVAFSPGFASGFDGFELRMSFGCVGLDETYAFSKEAEIKAAAVALLDQAMLTSGDSLDRVGSFMEELEDKLGDSQQNQGFLYGRKVIENALLDRIVPAIIKIARSNLGDVTANLSDGKVQDFTNVVRFSEHKQVRALRFEK
jgi:aspartate aminotransferase